jgi:hypothetical protein
MKSVSRGLTDTGREGDSPFCAVSHFCRPNASPATTSAALLKASKGGSSMKNQPKGRANQITMTVTSTQSDAPRSHVQQGAIYRDRSKNLIRLLSICGSYCLYVFLPNPRCSMHGSVTGLTRKDVFEAEFVFVGGSVGDWVENQRKHSNESAPTVAGRGV